MSDSSLLVNEHLQLASEIINTLTSIKFPDNPAVIFDIDNTLIDDFMKTIEPIVMVYNYLKMIGMRLIIVTNRQGSINNMYSTEAQLLLSGITGYELLYFRSPYINDLWAPKKEARYDIFKKGYNVIASIGDKPWDFGHLGGVSFLVHTTQ
jgi:predicted secreted acid phosphatase